MINILSYVGMNMQSEVCLWTLLGLMRTIFDATLFKVNANLKQVWQMSMPVELSMPVQRVLRTMISGIMLVQCFTVYVYLASYIVLLYPVFLEERPTLVLPWLLLDAIRKLLCELTSLAMGLGTCVLLGPAKPPCIKFVVAKIVTIMPSFYIWILVYSYYNALKVATAYKTFPIVLPPSGLDYGLELAVRRRCTKSLFGEEQLRKKLEAGFYGEAPPSININITSHAKAEDTSRNASGSDVCNDDTLDRDVLRPLSTVSNKLTDVGAYEDWFGSEIMVPRGDRILEQFVVMLLRIAAYLKNDGTESINSQMFNSALTATWATRENIEAMPTDITDTPPLVGNKGHTPSYLSNYPQIFMKKLGTEAPQTDRKMIQTTENAESVTVKRRLRTLSSKSNKSYNSNETTSLESKRIVSDTILNLSSKSSVSKEIRQKSKISEEATDKVKLPTQERGRDIHSKSLNNHAVKNVKQIIAEVFDVVLEQVLNRSNVVHDNLVVEKPSSSDVDSDQNEDMLQCCSKFINNAPDEPLQCKAEEIICTEEIKYPENNNTVQVHITSNTDNKKLDIKNIEHNEINKDNTIGLATTHNIENITPNAVVSFKDSKTEELYTADNEDTIPLDNSNTQKLSVANDVATTLLENSEEGNKKVVDGYSVNIADLAITGRVENITPNATDDIKDTKTEELYVANNLKSIHSDISNTENKEIVNDNCIVAVGLAITNNKENVKSNNEINVNADKLSIVNHAKNMSLDKINTENNKNVDGISADITDLTNTSGKDINTQNVPDNFKTTTPGELFVANNADKAPLSNNNTKDNGIVDCNSADNSGFATTENKEKNTPNEADNKNSTNLDELFVAMHVDTVSLENTNTENKEIVTSNIADTSGLATNNCKQDNAPNKTDSAKNTNNDSNMESKETINANRTNISGLADTNRVENNTSNAPDNKTLP